MSSECDALRNEIQRLRQEIAGLNNRFIPIAERPLIYSAISSAREVAVRADLKADNAIAGARIAQGAALVAQATAIGALAAAGTAQATAVGAVALATTAGSIAQAALAGVAFVLGVLERYVTRERLSALENRVNVLDNLLQVLTNAIGTLAGRITANTRAIDAVKARLDTLFSFFYALQGMVSALIGRISSLEAKVSYLESLLDSFEVRIRSLFVRVNTLEDLVKEIQSRLEFAHQRITALSGLLAALTAVVTALGIVVAGLSRTVAALAAAVAALQAQLIALRAAIFTIGRTVARLAVRIATVERIARDALRRAQDALSLARRALSKAVSAYNLANSAFQQAMKAYSIAIQARGIARLALDKANSALRLAQRAIAKIQDLTRFVLRIDFRVQILERLMELIQQRLTEIKELLMGSANGAISLAPCLLSDASDPGDGSEAETRIIQFNGSGLTGLYSTTKALAEVVEVLHENTKCNSEILNRLDGSGNGIFDLSLCEPPEDPDAEPLQATYEGKGLGGVYSAIAAITESLNLIHADTKCPPDTDCNAALPMAFETKVGEIPQLVILWGNVEGGSSRWAMNLPHPRADLGPKSQFSFPPYRKGNVQFTLVLKDNSKIILNANSKADGQGIMAYLKTLVNPAFLTDAQPRITENAGSGNLASPRVRATFIKAFSGHRDQAPLWSKALRE